MPKTLRRIIAHHGIKELFGFTTEYKNLKDDYKHTTWNPRRSLYLNKKGSSDRVHPTPKSVVKTYTLQISPLSRKGKGEKACAKTSRKYTNSVATPVNPMSALVQKRMAHTLILKAMEEIRWCRLRVVGITL
ncbi:predicted protein [Histoplasma mississippiense (nom. inval.)]|uniref:predicted protein n=1 Tax=Ajellomyces capsulatus (strain NAm1 / WU24) TaxID=2059318 RepID=UPI000157C72C|nr:predicted protein [Histoplasma mississippiense (nom. inval.)]EDN08414.1 predicted protein [Histoplasma mississippiense (nom. inval.)]